MQTKWVDVQGKTLEVVLHRNASKNRGAMPAQRWERFEYRELPGHISYMVLSDSSTCSAAEDFLIPLKVQKRAKLIGEPTCGSSGQPLFFSIYGADARVCTKWDRFPDGTEFVGVGVLPDVPANRTREDVAAGRDAAFEEAIRLASR